MGIDVQWVAADGSILDELLDSEEVLDRALSRENPGLYPLLRAIDPYADTDVSPSRELSAEVRGLRDQQTDPEVSAHFNRFLSMSEAAEANRGSYLRFIGD